MEDAVIQFIYNALKVVAWFTTIIWVIDLAIALFIGSNNSEDSDKAVGVCFLLSIISWVIIAVWSGVL